jgi:hypothetical protein
MGREAQCTATWKRRCSDGKALLETESVVFRGEFRVELPFSDITTVGAARGRLTLSSALGTLVLDLGDEADRWAGKIRNPPRLADKLGVTGETRVLLVGVDDPLVIEPVRLRAKAVTRRMTAGADIVIVGMNRASDLRRFERLRNAIAAHGAIWSIRPKGVAELAEAVVRAAARAAGLVDVKVARVSDTHTAEKFVVPRAGRPGSTGV